MSSRTTLDSSKRIYRFPDVDTCWYSFVQAQAHPEADLQADSPVLQLAWHCEGSCSLPVCSQACLPCEYFLASAVKAKTLYYTLILSAHAVLVDSIGPTIKYFYILRLENLFTRNLHLSCRRLCSISRPYNLGCYSFMWDLALMLNTLIVNQDYCICNWFKMLRVCSVHCRESLKFNSRRMDGLLFWCE